MVSTRRALVLVGSTTAPASRGCSAARPRTTPSVYVPGPRRAASPPRTSGAPTTRASCPRDRRLLPTGPLARGSCRKASIVATRSAPANTASRDRARDASSVTAAGTGSRSTVLPNTAPYFSGLAAMLAARLSTSGPRCGMMAMDAASPTSRSPAVGWLWGVCEWVGTGEDRLVLPPSSSVPGAEVKRGTADCMVEVVVKASDSLAGAMVHSYTASAPGVSLTGGKRGTRDAMRGPALRARCVALSATPYAPVPRWLRGSCGRDARCAAVRGASGGRDHGRTGE